MLLPVKFILFLLLFSSLAALLSCAKFDLEGTVKAKQRASKDEDGAKEEVKNVTKCSQLAFKVTLSSIHQTVYHMAIK